MKLIETLTEENKKSCKIERYDKGQIIFHENEECLYVGLVKKGSVQIVSYSLSGKEIVYNEIKENGIFGNNLLFSKNPYYRGNVIAKTDAEILLINKEKLIKILQNNALFLELYLSEHADFSKKLNNTIKILSLDSAEERFLYYLKENSPLKYHSISSLASSIFLTRETTSRLVSRLVKEGKIVQKGKVLSLKK